MDDLDSWVAAQRALLEAEMILRCAQFAVMDERIAASPVRQALIEHFRDQALRAEDEDSGG